MIRIFCMLAGGLALLGLGPVGRAEPTAESAPLTLQEMNSAAKVDSFSIPTPGELMSALNKLGKPNWAEEIRSPITTNFSSRAQMALNLGGLIADGYIAVEAEDAQQVKNIGTDIGSLAKALSVQQDLIVRVKSLREFAEHGDWNTLKEEFDATQNEVKAAMAKNKDQDLITLVTLGAWIRGTEVITDYVAKNYTDNGAKLLRQPEIVHFLSDQLMSLPKEIRDEPSVRSVRERLLEIETTVSFPRDKAPALETVKTLNTITSDLVNEVGKKESQ